jgi:hypothetical protein
MLWGAVGRTLLAILAASFLCGYCGMRWTTAEVHSLGVAGFPVGSQPGRVGSACLAR